MKNNTSKIALIILSLALLVGAAIGFSASAEATAPEIVSKNIDVNGNYCLMLAVNPATVAGDDVTITIYEQLPAEGVEPAQTITKAKTATEKIDLDHDGTEEYDAIVFYTAGVSAKDIADVWYITTTSGGVTSDVETYSVREYAFERLYKNGTVFATSEADGKAYLQRQFYLEILDVGSAAQQLLVNYGKPEAEKEKLAKGYIYAAVVGGTYTIGETTLEHGFVNEGDVLTLNSTDESVETWNVFTFGPDGNMYPDQQTVDAGGTITVTGNTVAIPYEVGVNPGKYFDEIGDSWFSFESAPAWPFDNTHLAHTKQESINSALTTYGNSGIMDSGEDKYGKVLLMGKELDDNVTTLVHFPIAAATSDKANVIVVEMDFKLLTSGTEFYAGDISETEAKTTGIVLQWNKEPISGGKFVADLTSMHKVSVLSVDSDATLDEKNVGGDALRFFGSGENDLKKDVWYNICYELYTDVNKGVLYINGVAVHTFDISELAIADVNSFSFEMQHRFRNKVYFDNVYCGKIAKEYVAP